MYLIMATVEVVVGLVTGYLDFSLFSLNTYSSIFGLIACRIISYAVVLMLANFKNIKTGETVQNSNWISIALIPIASLYLTLLLFQAREITEIQILVGVIFIILINFSTFYLYDVITAALSDKMKNRLILEQNKYYDNQLEMIKSSLQTTNAIRHDLKNHMFSIRTLMENGDTKESLNYIFKIMDDIGTRKDYSTSGNTVIDSIINFKFQEADQRGIKTDLDIKIPERLEIPSFDITIILGNLLDNAIKAASEVKENRFINIRIKFDKGRLQIEVENSYAGVINEEKGKFLTSHIDKKNHGIGLETVKKTVQKYNGTMKIDYNDTIFAIFLFMYVD
ncbi:MAG TPA: GHKL domain-containing protein [Bacillota bacterium]|nr:GHKL domain-containing protein [Bacillota bacterium]